MDRIRLTATCKEESVPQEPRTITLLLRAASQGDRAAEGRLVERVYDELRKQARRICRVRGVLEPTVLVHEAYLRIGADGSKLGVRDRRHFFRLAARIMRGVLVDHIRAEQAEKRGGQHTVVTLDPQAVAELEAVDFLALDEALEELSSLEPESAEIVHLKFFGGFSHQEIGELLGLSLATVGRRWKFARNWLYLQLLPEGAS